MEILTIIARDLNRDDSVRGAKELGTPLEVVIVNAIADHLTTSRASGIQAGDRQMIGRPPID